LTTHGVTAGWLTLNDDDDDQNDDHNDGAAATFVNKLGDHYSNALWIHLQASRQEDVLEPGSPPFRRLTALQ
jgi:hypothetical protein